MDAPQPVGRLAFGPFELDVATGNLYADGHPVRLQEQPRQILLALATRPGEVVTRDELRERVWRSDTFVDFEHGLNTAIKKVRQALRDSAESPSYIETVARRGYRFVATISSVTAVPTATAAPKPTTRTGRTKGPTWVALALAAVVVLVATAVYVTRASIPPPAVPPAPGLTKIAVLPFRILAASDADDRSYLGVGIADAVIARLTHIRQMALVPTWAVLRFDSNATDPAAVASVLGVSHLVVGTVQPAGDRYRVSVQLVTHEGRAAWARSYDETATTFLAMQDHIADEIASALRLELSPPERERLHLRYTENPAAYDLYLRGRTLLVDYTEANMREAIGFFERALAIDANYALARASLATASAWFSVRYAYERDALEWGRRADTEARRALARDPSLADAQLAIASAAGTLFGGFDWSVVLDRSTAALALDRSLDLAHVVRMRAWYHLGRFEEVGREAELARAINPMPNTEADRLEVAANLFGGNFQRAADQATTLLARTDAPAVRHYLGLARFYLGDDAGAREILGAVRRGNDPDVRSQASLASIEAATGRPSAALARIRGILAGSYMDHHVAYSLGATFAQLGQTARAIEFLQQAADTGFPCPPWLAKDRLLDPIRETPEFKALSQDRRPHRP